MVPDFSFGGSMEYAVYHCNFSIETLLLVFCGYYGGKCCLHHNDFLYDQTGRTQEERQNTRSPIRSIAVFRRSVARHVHCLWFCSMKHDKGNPWSGHSLRRQGKMFGMFRAQLHCGIHSVARFQKERHASGVSFFLDSNARVAVLWRVKFSGGISCNLEEQRVCYG